MLSICTLQHTATHCNTLQHWQYTRQRRERKRKCDVPPACTLQHTASHCNTLQHTATHQAMTLMKTKMQRSHMMHICNTLHHTAPHCNALQLAATHQAMTLIKNENSTCPHCAHCNTLQHTATHCNTLHHAAILCNPTGHDVDENENATSPQPLLRSSPTPCPVDPAGLFCFEIYGSFAWRCRALLHDIGLFLEVRLSFVL